MDDAVALCGDGSGDRLSLIVVMVVVVLLVIVIVVVMLHLNASLHCRAARCKVCVHMDHSLKNTLVC